MKGKEGGRGKGEGKELGVKGICTLLVRCNKWVVYAKALMQKHFLLLYWRFVSSATPPKTQPLFLICDQQIFTKCQNVALSRWYYVYMTFLFHLLIGECV